MLTTYTCLKKPLQIHKGFHAPMQQLNMTICRSAPTSLGGTNIILSKMMLLQLKVTSVMTTYDDNRKILTDVDAKVLEAGASPAVAGVGHREPVLLALLLAGKVGQLVEQVVRGRVPLLRPPH